MNSVSVAQKKQNSETAAAGFAICSPGSAPENSGKRPIQILGQRICKVKNFLSGNILSYVKKKTMSGKLQFQNKIYVDIPPHIGYPPLRPGGSGAAEPRESRQVRKEAAVSRCLRVPPGSLPGHFLFPFPLSNQNISSIINHAEPVGFLSLGTR
jgi:hypothetical protein